MPRTFALSRLSLGSLLAVFLVLNGCGDGASLSGISGKSKGSEKPGPAPEDATATATATDTRVATATDTAAATGTGTGSGTGTGTSTSSEDQTPQSPPRIPQQIGHDNYMDLGCAIVEGRHVWCWGTESRYISGLNSTTKAKAVLVPEFGVDVQSIEINGGKACVVRGDHTVCCLGGNGYGDLGDPSLLDYSTPKQLTGLGSDVQLVSIGARHDVFAMKTSGDLWGMGAFESLKLGTAPVDAPRQETSGIAYATAPFLTGILTDTPLWISARGQFHGCAVKADHSLWCWGSNDLGELGVGLDVPNSSAALQVTDLGAHVASAATGSRSACAVKDDGTLWCWGYNGYGDLGLGSADSTPKPAQVAALGSDVAQVALGDAVSVMKSCARKTDGSVWCWGSDHFGTASPTANVPQKIAGLPKPAVDIISNGKDCALLDDFSVYCWGADYMPYPISFP